MFFNEDAEDDTVIESSMLDVANIKVSQHADDSPNQRRPSQSGHNLAFHPQQPQLRPYHNPMGADGAMMMPCMNTRVGGPVNAADNG